MVPKKLYTNFSCTSKMNKEESPSCNHFSLRGYVAEMRQKDLNLCLAFPVNGSETRPSLPPLVVRRFRSWSCNVCLGENEFNMDDQSDQRTCCEGTQETLTCKSVPARKKIDINKLIDLTGDSDDSESDRMSIHEEEKNDDEVSINEIPGNSDKNGENEHEIQDLHQKKSSKKFKRMRLLREILREDDEPVAEHIRRGRPELQNPSNESADSQKQKTVMEKVVGEGDTKKLEKKGQPGRKRKLVADEDEEDVPLTDLIQRAGNEVSNEEGLEERLHLSSNRSPQTLLRPVQEGSGGETNSTGERRSPLTSAFSTEGEGVPIEEINEATREHNELEALDALLQISQINTVNVEPEPDPQIKQLKGMDFDLNLPHCGHHTDEYMLNGNIGLGISIDLNVAAEGIDPDECSKTKMEKSHAAAIFGGNLNGPSACGWLDQEEETPTQHCGGIRAALVSLNNNISERFCGTNRNPADFTPIAPWNPYMREKKDKVPIEVTGENRSHSYSEQNKRP